MLKRVPTIQTYFTSEDLIKELISNWILIYKKTPKKEQIGVIYSQWALETGQGLYCWNFNIGNLKAADDPNKIIEYCVLNGVWEIINNKRVIIPPENPGSWFRSFATLADGIAHHLEFLRNKRYKNSWVAVENGNPAEFAHLLKMAGYYTASEADYIKAINTYFNIYMKMNAFENVIKNLPMPKIESKSNIKLVLEKFWPFKK